MKCFLLGSSVNFNYLFPQKQTIFLNSGTDLSCFPNPVKVLQSFPLRRNPAAQLGVQRKSITRLQKGM